MRKLLQMTLLLILGMGAASCLPTFDVDVATPEPIKVDLSMDVHVYQHGESNPADAKKQTTYREAMTSRRNRMAEIQELKNNRLVGENREGTLTLRNRPAGEYGEYVSDTVSDENRDREILMRHEADEKGIALNQIREDQWKHWQRKSFPGEWIEVEKSEGSGFQWIQKEDANR
ncbi:MAG: DUF1318 domain-containing protein [Verrucomicrobiota bacterium]